ncbi:S-adenosyl-L-methionine-dependent methyltransferase [Exophiala viscosa]|uniref:S-adenosyl-L-methionine-dependent methyltransferase n=1 Tax=Exophiala viscosa TaxID=2486360 RepID=UPI00219C458D|nr:S-adenosyl-L-methionine-dependent methyltransferase [Exophiala viscosa]
MPATRLRPGTKRNLVETGALLPDATIEERIAALANELQRLESPADLALLYPPQFSNTWQPEEPYRKERDILDELIAMEDHKPATEEKDFLEFHLGDFCVYCSPGHHRGCEGQYESLLTVAAESQHLPVKDAHKHKLHWLLDGVLEHKGTQRRIMGAQIIDVSIGGFEDLGEHSTDGLIWIMTLEGSRRGYWYRLTTPTAPYRKYWADFVWLSRFCKYFIDYLFDSSTREICLLDFKTNFWEWLRKLHGDKVNGWHSQCAFKKGSDYRSRVLRHAQFLWNQAYSLYGADHAKLTYSIWDEINAGHFTHDKQGSSTTEKTIVTANVAYTFLKIFPHWKTQFDLLEVVRPCAEVEAYRQQRLKGWDFPDKFGHQQRSEFMGEEQISKAALILEQALPDRPVRAQTTDELLRKVVIVRIKSENSQYELRYAWVRAVSWSLKTINVVWLALPTDTICGSMDDGTFYAIGNELFFTDECNCVEVMAEDIVKVIDASVFADHAQGRSEIFVHCLYRTKEEVFVNAVEENLTCRCRSSKRAPFTKKKQPESPTTHAAQQPRTKLKVLSLFSGCGLLDHAFCAPGYAQTDIAIEHCEVAIRSYRANDEQNHTRCVLGSVNEQFLKYLRGDECIGQIDCITAGCPCQGFSSLNAHKHNLKGQKNCSLLAHTLSWVEIFMPAYMVIENVPRMDSGRPNACAQAMCHLVALGYQVRKMLCEVSGLGGASKRKRIIIIAAAPGVVLPNAIPNTYGDGKSQMAIRTSSQAMSGLPALHNDTVINIADPDHVPLQRLGVDFRQGVNFRSLVQHIPTKPNNMSLTKTYNKGGLSLSQRNWYKTLHRFKRRKDSTCLTRINSDKPFQTICTKIGPMCAKFSGVIIHPFEDRTISLKEARLAMDVPDWFLLVGSISDQFKMLGNGVPWVLGAAIGRAVGKSWVASLERRANRAIGHVAKRQGQDIGNATQKFDGVYVSANSRRVRHVVPDDEEEVRSSTKVKRPRPVVTDSDKGKRGLFAGMKRTRPVILDDDDDDESDSSMKIIAARREKKRPQW